VKQNLHKLNLRKVVSAAEAAKSSEERWRLISWGITFEGSMMLKAPLTEEVFRNYSIEIDFPKL